MITIQSVWFEEGNIFVKMSNDSIIGTPINWYPNLNKGTQEQLKNFEIKGKGKWLHWSELDEDLSAEGFLAVVSSHMITH